MADLSNLTYAQTRDFAVNTDFQQRLAVAVADAAIAVYTEATTVPNHAARAAYATEAVKNPEAIAKQMTWAVVMLANDDADATLKQTVMGIWNAFAGV